MCRERLRYAKVAPLDVSFQMYVSALIPLISGFRWHKVSQTCRKVWKAVGDEATGHQRPLVDSGQGAGADRGGWRPPARTIIHHTSGAGPGHAWSAR